MILLHNNTIMAQRKPLGNLANQKRVPGQERKIFGVYSRSMLTSKIAISITEIGKNVKQNLEAKIVQKNEGHCIIDGFVQPNSVKIITYSSGKVVGEKVEFTVVFECMICHPVEGMIIEADVKTVTKAGIHAQVEDEMGTVPVTIFVARDHHHLDANFNATKENTKITVKVIGIRYELNDPYICVIAKLMDSSMGRGRGERGGTNQISYQIEETL